jgi:hypothetical protein
LKYVITVNEGEITMLTDENKNEIKAMILMELETLFTNVDHKFNSKENEEMMLYLMDIEKALKERLTEVSIRKSA